MDLHKAIRAIHSSVVTINGDTEKTLVATIKSHNHNVPTLLIQHLD